MVLNGQQRTSSITKATLKNGLMKFKKLTVEGRGNLSIFLDSLMA